MGAPSKKADAGQTSRFNVQSNKIRFVWQVYPERDALGYKTG
jgi:hypothetical protein